MKTKFATVASVAAGCAVLALTLTACGDDTEEQTDDWAQAVCQDFGTQVLKLQEAQAAIEAIGNRDIEPTEAQEAYSAAYGDLQSGYSALATTVEAAGPPPGDDGEQLMTDSVAELEGRAAVYGEIKTAIDEADTSDRSAWADGLRQAIDKVDELPSGDALEELQSGDRSDAMARQEGCQLTVPTSPAEPEEGGSSPEASPGESPEESPAEGSEGSEGDGEADAEAGETADDASGTESGDDAEERSGGGA